MIDQRLVDRVIQLPAQQRLELIELLTRSLHDELTTEVQEPGNSSDSGAGGATEEVNENLAAIERLARSLKLDAPVDSSLWRVLGLGAMGTTPPTDEELKEDYVNYLIEKYS